MNSNTDRKHIVSYFCILFILCGVNTVSYTYTGEAAPDHKQPCCSGVTEDCHESQCFSGGGMLSGRKTAPRSNASGSRNAGALLQPAYNIEAFDEAERVGLDEDIVTMLTLILKARYLLC